MLYALLKTLHLLCVILWVGGMVFAHFFLRPALADLPAPQRLTLMHAVLRRFFAAVLWASTLAFASGGWMLARSASRAAAAGLAPHLPLEWLVMAVLGTLMVFIFLFLRLQALPRLGRAVQAQAWPQAAAALALIRRGVMVNLGLGLAVVLVTLLGGA
ncbi:MAG: hypothetical protein FGM55_11935 [Rhodoferax sp.]|nr:hypothetical protein [Rhodoferax sp.]